MTIIKVSVNDETLDDLKECLGITDNTELLRVAYNLLHWAANEVEQDRAVLSSNNVGKDVHKVTMSKGEIYIKKLSKARTHTTSPAESLEGIALRELGDATRWTEIRDLNSDKHPDMKSYDYYTMHLSS